MDNDIIPAIEFSRDDLKSLWATFRSECFRLETFPQYKVAGERDMVEPFMRGEPLPPRVDTFWEINIRSTCERGATFSRVHLMPVRKNPYLRYALELGHP